MTRSTSRFFHVATLVDDEMSYGGPVTVALNQCAELRRRGLDARLVAGWRGRSRPPVHLDGVPVHLFPVLNVVPGARFSGLVAPSMIRWLRAQAGPDDVGHIHLARDLVPLLAAQVFRARSTPYVTQTHGMVTADRRVRARLMDTALTRPVLNQASTRLVLTKDEKADLSEVFEGPAESMVRIGNGVRLPAGDRGPRSGSEPLEVLFLSRLHPRKRVLDFARAALLLLAEGCPARFAVVGPDDGDLAPLQELLAQAGHPPGIRYEGPLDHGAALARLAGTDIYVLPSVDEPFPMSLLEALAAGTPSLCTTGCAVAAELGDGGMAVVVPPGVAGLAAGLRRLIADSGLRDRLSSAATAGIRARYSIEAIGDELEKAYACARLPVAG